MNFRHWDGRQAVAGAGKTPVIRALALGGLLASTLSTGALAAYSPAPGVGDVFALTVDLEVDGVVDFLTSVTVTSGVSGTQNATIGAFSFENSDRTFSFDATPATWDFAAASTSEDGLTARAIASSCSAGAEPCRLSINFLPTYDGTYVRTIGDSDNSGLIRYARLVAEGPAPIPEPGSLLLLLSGLGLAGLFLRKQRKA